ncbi:hypothetical protein [Streptomyces sp. NPDC057287]|uniref:hypothetical protein n=1 Tax=Streptomyces sp. NPDC057287 TaxID=3346086 RepID=UPI003631C4BC
MWDYAALTAEAAKLGGPAALRAFYRQAGRQQGFIMGVAVGGVCMGGAMLYNMKSPRVVVIANVEPTPQSSVETPEPGVGIAPAGATPS